MPVEAALVAGLALALSSTAIAVQTMAERNELTTPTGRAAFGILLFQDIAAIPMIAAVPLPRPREKAAAAAAVGEGRDRGRRDRGRGRDRAATSRARAAAHRATQDPRALHRRSPCCS
jgi:hypothetical protein